MRARLLKCLLRKMIAANRESFIGAEASKSLSRVIQELRALEEDQDQST